MGIGGYRHAPAALPNRKRPGIHCVGSWVGPRAGLDGCEESRLRLHSIPGTSIFGLISHISSTDKVHKIALSFWHRLIVEVTQLHTTVGGAPLDEWSARRRDWQHTTLHAPDGIRTRSQASGLRPLCNEYRLSLSDACLSQFNQVQNVSSSYESRLSRRSLKKPHILILVCASYTNNVFWHARCEWMGVQGRGPGVNLRWASCICLKNHQNVFGLGHVTVGHCWLGEVDDVWWMEVYIHAFLVLGVDGWVVNLTPSPAACEDGCRFAPPPPIQPIVLNQGLFISGWASLDHLFLQRKSSSFGFPSVWCL
jgi:hypothetical protein